MICALLLSPRQIDAMLAGLDAAADADPHARAINWRLLLILRRRYGSLAAARATAATRHDRHQRSM